MCVCMCVYARVYAHACFRVQVEVREQLAGISSLLSSGSRGQIQHGPV